VGRSKTQGVKIWGFPPHAPPLLGGLSSCLGAEPPPDPPNKRFLAGSNLMVGDVAGDA